MKKFVAETVAEIGTRIILVLDFFYDLTIRFITFFHTLFRGAIGHGFYAVVKFADRERIEAAEQLVELKAQNIELKLLASASKVRDHAVETDDWTDHHTQAIEAIGDALLNECNWEEEHIHNYLREIVQSVDGLTYELFDDDADAV